jgi:hypothetical protein
LLTGSEAEFVRIAHTRGNSYASLRSCDPARECSAENFDTATKRPWLRCFHEAYPMKLPTSHVRAYLHRQFVSVHRSEFIYNQPIRERCMSCRTSTKRELTRVPFVDYLRSTECIAALVRHRGDWLALYRLGEYDQLIRVSKDEVEHMSTTLPQHPILGPLVHDNNGSVLLRRISQSSTLENRL